MKRKALVGLDILEMTENGLQLVANLPSLEASYKKEEWEEAISDMAEKLYQLDRMFLSTDEIGIILRGMKTKTYVVKGVFDFYDSK